MATAEGSNKYKIDKTKKGLFVIIKQLTHNLNYEHRSDLSPADDKKKDSWWGYEPLNYNPDEKKLRDVFELPEEMEQDDNPHKLLYGDDLTNGHDGEEKKSFETFMEKVCSQSSPAFVMLFLMSHGFPKGEFLLARQSMTDVGSCCIDGNGKKKARHDLTGSCYARSIDKDIIDKIGESYPDVPKMYIIQTCRGGDHTPTYKKGGTDKHVSIEPSDIELFIPKHQHTFVYRACVEGNAAFVSNKGCDSRIKEGSLLIQYFCESVRELTEDSLKFGNLLKLCQVDKTKELVQQLQESREDLIGGWMMNVCQRATSKITNYLYVQVALRDSQLNVLFLRDWNNDLVGRITSQDVNVTQALQSELLNTLEIYQDGSRHTQAIDGVLQLIQNIASCYYHIIQYLWKRLNRIERTWDPWNSKEELQKLGILDCLEAIISEVQDQKPDSNQQPHISSSLCKKLSLLDLMGK